MTIPKKHLGQNFLRDQMIVEKIIHAIAPHKTDHMLEIGPGLGALTKNLLQYLPRITVIELDPDLIPKLKNACKNLGELKIYQQDATQFQLNKITENKDLRIIGNLPYNITSPLIFNLLNQIKYIQDMHFMLQKEVAERLAAKPGNKIYGRLTVMVQYFCAVELLFTVPPDAFYPKPKVDSAFVRLIPYKKIPFLAQDFKVFEKIVKKAFGQRRKTIRNNLKDFISTEQLEQLNISPTLRAEQLSISDFVKIANLFI